MTENGDPLENAIAERLNGIIKDEYLENYEVVREDLQKSKGKILVHPALRCSEDKLQYRLWEGKGIVDDGEIKIIGKNMLGNLWMKLREYI